MVAKSWRGEGFIAVVAVFPGVDQMEEVAFCQAGDPWCSLGEAIHYNDPDMASTEEMPKAWNRVEEGTCWFGPPPDANHGEHEYLHIIIPPESVKLVKASEYEEGKYLYYHHVNSFGDDSRSTNMKNFVVRTKNELEAKNAQAASEVVILIELGNVDGSLTAGGHQDTMMSETLLWVMPNNTGEFRQNTKWFSNHSLYKYIIGQNTSQCDGQHYYPTSNLFGLFVNKSPVT